VTDRSKTVVMLIDWDNLQICHSRDAPGTDLDLHALIALAQSYGTLVSARAYAEWNLLSERLAVYKAGIEPVFAPVMRPEGSPREGKSLADTVMVADGVDLLWTVAPDVFVLVTSDKDMIPLARIAKQRGAAVVVLGSDLTAIPLVEMSNVFITYRQLLRELDRVVELEAPSGRQPARERRLRETRRPSSDPYGGSGPIGAPGIGAPGQLGSTTRSTSRTVTRPVALHGPTRTAEPTIQRRPAVPVTPAIVERPLIAPSTAPLASTTEPAAEAEDLSPLTATDATPRRRRRRGGRGRRPGSEGIGDVDLPVGERAGESVGSEGDELPERRASPEVRADDLDSAVLELLASRDRDVEPLSVPEPTAEEPTVPTVEPEIRTAQSRVIRTPVRRRPIATSFSEFGPPPIPRRSPAGQPDLPPTAPEAESPESVVNQAPTEPVEAASPNDSEAGAESVVTATGATGPVDAAEPVPETGASTTEAEASPFAEASTETTDADSVPTVEVIAGAPTESTNGSEQAVSDEPPADGEAARPVRRRRVRRPTTRTSSKSKADTAADAPVTAESGT